MRFQGTASFQQTWERLPQDRRERARQALEKLEEALRGKARPEGLGLKKLRNLFWEIRTGLKDRILFTLEKDLITFVLIGNHDEVHRFLRNQ